MGLGRLRLAEAAEAEGDIDQLEAPGADDMELEPAVPGAASEPLRAAPAGEEATAWNLIEEGSLCLTSIYEFRTTHHLVDLRVNILHSEHWSSLAVGRLSATLR